MNKNELGVDWSKYQGTSGVYPAQPVTFVLAQVGGTTIKKITNNKHNGIPDSEEEGLVEEPLTIEENGKVDEFSEKN